MPGVVRIRLVFASALFALLMLLTQTGCSGGSSHGSNPPPTPTPIPGGFSVGVQTVNGNTGVQTGWETVTGLVGMWDADETGAVGATKNFGPFSGLTPVGVTGGRAPAIWSGSYTDASCPSNLGELFWSNVPISPVGTNILGACDNPPGGAAVPAFVTSNSLPTTFTVKGSGLTTAHGIPKMDFYDELVNHMTTLSATSVSADGTTATFPFPTNNGSTLAARHYTFVVSNQTAPGVFADAFSGVFSIGTADTSRVTPYGIDLADISTTVVSSNHATTTVTQSPIVTLDSSSQVLAYWDQTAITVGAHPVAVRAYGAVTRGRISCGRTGICSGETQNVPSKAIVANFGSNTVSLVEILTSAGVFSGAVTNLAVGTSPCAVLLNGSTAYVANYGSSSVSVINLSTNVVSGTISVGGSPAALALDPSGTSLWVGGLNFITQYNLSTFAAMSSVPSVSGQVTSLGISKALNSVVYTSVSTDHTLYSAVQADLAAGTFSAVATPVTPVTPGAATVVPDGPINAALVVNKTTTVASADIRGTNFANTPSGAPPGFLASSGALVSVPYGNRYSVMATPTGFTVQDLQSGTTILSGSTSNPVRGIATDAQTGMIYVTVPDSNTIISVPFPPTP